VLAETSPLNVYFGQPAYKGIITALNKMEEKLNFIKKEICRALRKFDNSEWHATKLFFDFPPYINKGWTGAQFFYDQHGNKIRLGFLGDDEFNNNLYDFISKVNQKEQYNRITFTAHKDSLDDAEISIIFNQEIVDNFENNLPKSKRGKTIPWWR
jgi:hypothetical protein